MELELDWGNDDDEEEEEEAAITPKAKEPKMQAVASTEAGESCARTTSGKLDIMAHQLKFIACLKIIAEELSTLATGIEADGGTLRRQFYMWLEKEVRLLSSAVILF